MRALLFFVLLFLNVNAAPKKEASSQAKESIEIAQNLILQKDRAQAIRILSKAYSLEKNKVMLSEIKDILRDLGSLFLYDKSQQEYESSLNLKKTDPIKSIEAIEKAQKIEPDNTLIVFEVLRDLVNKNNLAKAKEIAEEFKSKNPHDKNIIIASVFIALANKDNKEIQIGKAKIKELQSSTSPALLGYIEFLEKIETTTREKTLLSLALFKKADPQNPQIAYWESRLASKKAIESEGICGTFPEYYYRRYQQDLFFCSPSLVRFFTIKEPN